VAALNPVLTNTSLCGCCPCAFAGFVRASQVSRGRCQAFTQVFFACSLGSFLVERILRHSFAQVFGLRAIPLRI